MNKHEIIESPCCECISQRLFLKNESENQLGAILDKKLKYKKNEEDIIKYIDNMLEAEKELIKDFLYMDKKELIERLKNDDEFIEKFFKFVKFLFSENEAYGDKNYVLMLEKSIFDKIDSSQNLTPENLEFIKTILNNNVQFFNYFFPEKNFSKVVDSNILVKKYVIRKLIDKKIINPFNISQIQKILRGETFSFNSGTGKMRIETHSIKVDEEKKAIIENMGLQGKYSEDEHIPVYSLHVTPGIEIAKDSKNILSTIQKLNQLMTGTEPCVLLDSWLLDVEYENFCKQLKPILKKKLKENINNNPDIQYILYQIETNKNNPEKLKKLSEKLKLELSSLCIIDDNNIAEEMVGEENEISTRLKVIKEHIIYSTTYKLRDAERCKKKSRLDNEISNIKNNNAEEARQHIKECIQKGNISGLVLWIENLVIQEYLLQKYEKDLGLGHGRVIVSLDDVNACKSDI